MGYYYDWLDERWHPIDHDRKLSREQRRQIARRRHLIEDLLIEIADSEAIARLYAQLMVRTLISSDQDLMREFGERRESRRSI